MKRKTVEFFRKKHPKFIYQDYDFHVHGNQFVMNFRFFISPDIVFYPTIAISPVHQKHVRAISEPLLNNLIFHCGLMEIPTYWKSTCSPILEIRPGVLSQSQLMWWRYFYINGLGEFFFQNNIDPTKKNFISFEQIPSKKKFPAASFHHSSDEVIVPIGGGKDSIVTLELLQRSGMEIRPWIVNPNAVHREMMSDLPNQPILVHRQIDSRLLDLNRKGYLNGHVPITAVHSMLAVLTSLLTDSRVIAFSNEQSANEPTAIIKGREINHQYSKSFDFEKRFIAYLREHISPSLNYFSFLRPLNELQISRLFSQFPKWFPKFLSCNEAWKTDSGRKIQRKQWCGKCPKCLFVYLSLAPFVPRKSLGAIFGSDLFEDRALWPMLEKMFGLKPIKPFECVGSRREIIAACRLSLLKRPINPPILLEKFQKTKRAQSVNPQTILSRVSRNHALPKKFFNVIGPAQNRSLNPFADVESKTVGILGFGFEGRELFISLRRHFPKKPIHLFEKKSFNDFSSEQKNAVKRDRRLILHCGSGYLRSLKQMEVVYKSPGIPPSEIRSVVKRNQFITNRTDIFFQHCPGVSIGITGTKGKSTTASFIHHLLKIAGRSSVLGGNIGEPIFHAMEKVKPGTIFVYECSSYQLADAHESPYIAILLNLFPEHLPYHGDFAKYAKAKSRITQFQTSRDVLIYNCKDPSIRKIAQRSKAKKIPFDPFDPKQHRYPFTASIAPMKIIADLFKLSSKDFQKALSTFHPLPHRLEVIGTFNNIRFINDSLSTVPASTIAALNHYKGSVATLIAGGFDRGISYASLGQEILSRKLQTLILFPDTGKRIAASVRKAWEKNPSVPMPKILSASSMEEAVRQSFEQTTKGKIVLLSPAASSFNLFHDYKDRGDQFRKFIRQFAQNQKV